jgi:hypothetical protein
MKYQSIITDKVANILNFHTNNIRLTFKFNNDLIKQYN